MDNIMATNLSEILQLSVAERIQLAEDIWDSIVPVPEALTLTDSQKAELDRRLLAYDRNPNEGISWDDLKKTLIKTS